MPYQPPPEVQLAIDEIKKGRLDLDKYFSRTTIFGETGQPFTFKSSDFDSFKTPPYDLNDTSSPWVVEYKKRLEREKEKERMEVPQIEYHEKKEKSRVRANTEEPPPLESNTDTEREEEQEYDGESENGEGEEYEEEGEYFITEHGVKGYEGADGKLYFMRSDCEYYNMI